MTHGVQAAGLGQSSAPQTGDPSAILQTCTSSMQAFARTFSGLSEIAGPALANVAAAIQNSQGGNGRG